MFCALLGQDIRRAFAGPLVLWFLLLLKKIDSGYSLELVVITSNAFFD